MKFTLTPQKPRFSLQEKRGFVHNILFYNAIPKHYIYTLYVLMQILLFAFKLFSYT